MKNKKSYIYIGLPILGILFYLAYLKRSAIDMVYSDYIRLINSYLPDVWNPDKFFVADLLTRIPVNFLERGLNVMIFGYSVTVDRVMGVLGFGLSCTTEPDGRISWHLDCSSGIMRCLTGYMKKASGMQSGRSWYCSLCCRL